jgi:hypothetical protein
MRLFAVAAFSLALAAPGTANAEDFPAEGSAAVAVERPFGIHLQHSSSDDQDYERDVSGFGVGWLRSESAYHQPRAAFDYFVADSLSVGGAVGLYFWGADGNRSGFLLAPRVGYAIMLSEAIAFWPRGGVTYYSEEENDTSYSQFGLSAEGMFVFMPQESWGILAGPTLDFGVVGEREAEQGDADFHQYAIGITTGLMGLF